MENFVRCRRKGCCYGNSSSLCRLDYREVWLLWASFFLGSDSKAYAGLFLLQALSLWIGEEDAQSAFSERESHWGRFVYSAGVGSLDERTSGLGSGSVNVG